MLNVLLRAFVVQDLCRFLLYFLNLAGNLAVVFLVAFHPVNVRAVTGVAGGEEVLSVVFVFASLLSCVSLVGMEEVTVFAG